MGRRKQPKPQTVSPVESTVTPVQTINPEGHTGNAWVPRGSVPTPQVEQPTQAPGQPTQVEQPTQAPGQPPGGLFGRRTAGLGRGMGVPNTGGGYAQSRQNWLRQRQQGQRQGLFSRSFGKSGRGRIAAPGQPMTNPVGSTVTPGVTKLPPPTTY